MAGRLNKILEDEEEMSPQMRQAEEFIQNTIKLRGLGPDDPIEWNAFETSPEERPKETGIASLFGAILPPAYAAGSSNPNKSSLTDRILEAITMAGFDTSEYDTPEKAKKRLNEYSEKYERRR